MFDFEDIPEDLGGPNPVSVKVLAEVAAADAADIGRRAATSEVSAFALKRLVAKRPSAVVDPVEPIAGGGGSHASSYLAKLLSMSETHEPAEPSPQEVSLTELRRLLSEHGLAESSSQFLNGGAKHISGAVCSAQDRSLFEALRRELGQGIRPFSGNWARGNGGAWKTPWRSGMGSEQVVDLNGQELPAHAHVLRKMGQAFGAELQMWWTNLYEDGSVGCEFHHDGHGPFNVTIGASFGAGRDLTFQHETTGQEVAFPQGNGDIFVFDARIDSLFLHGVYPGSEAVGPRISVIMMGHLRGEQPAPGVWQAWHRYLGTR